MAPRSRPGASRPDAPYAGFALVYDRLVGDPWFPTIRGHFEALIRRYRITYASAADLGCGTGTFARYLSEHAPVVYGVDRAAAMLRIAARKTAGSGVTLVRQDLARLRLPEAVDLMTCNFDTLNYILSVRTLGRVFARCRAFLRRGGHFLFDMILAPRHGRAPRPVVHLWQGPGLRSAWLVSADAGRRRSRVAMRYRFRVAPGRWRRTSEVHVQRWYPLPLVALLLGRAGFLLRGVHDMETLGQATPETGWAKFVARAV